MSNDNDGFSVILLLVYLWPVWLLIITYFTGRPIERKQQVCLGQRQQLCAVQERQPAG